MSESISGLKIVNFVLDDEPYEELKSKKEASGLSWPKFVLKVAGVKS